MTHMPLTVAEIEAQIAARRTERVDALIMGDSYIAEMRRREVLSLRRLLAERRVAVEQ